jgi:hypothetical protein
MRLGERLVLAIIIEEMRWCGYVELAGLAQRLTVYSTNLTSSISSLMPSAQAAGRRPALRIPSCSCCQSTKPLSRTSTASA